MCDCFHLAFPNWHAASSGTAGRRLRAPEPGTEDDSVCDDPSQFTEGERPRPQGSSPVEEFPEKYTDSDKECEAEHDPRHKSGGGKKSKKSGLGSMFEKRSTPKMSKLKEAHSPESEVIVKTATDGCAEGLVYGGGGKEGIFIKGVVPESPASKSLKLKEGDQILSATVYFDNVPYEDAVQILEHAQAYRVKLCLKRKPDITETEAAMESDVIPEEELCAPAMREQGKTKRRGDARISWPKFPSFGKGRKTHFTRSHSSSEADEQRKLELSPTTSDTESPIKSQDTLKGKKRHKMKLSLLTKRSRITSAEDTDAPTNGQTSSEVYQTASEMLSPDCLDSLSGETPQVYVTEELRLDQKDLTEPKTAQHKVDLICIDSTLKTADLTVALADQGSSSGIKSPTEKKKKKEKSELKVNILGKDKSHKKDAKAKASPKRLKTLGASIDIADQPVQVKSDSHTDLQRDQPPLEANSQIISSEASGAKLVTTQMEMSVPKVELDISDVTFFGKSHQKGEEPTKKDKETKQKKETKTCPSFKLPKIGLGDIATEETIQTSVNAEGPTKMEKHKVEGPAVKDDPYDRLSKSSHSRTQLPKREDIEIPGMEDMSVRTKAKKIKEPRVVSGGRYEDIQTEDVQMSIDVDSVKEAVSKLPGFKLPQVDPSGMPIPEEITVIDANAQRISVKTPTKVADTRSKQEAHLIKFDLTAADLTSEELLIRTQVDYKKPEKVYDIKTKQSDYEMQSEIHKREDIIIPGKESGRKEFGFKLPKQNFSGQEGGAILGERTILLQEVTTSKTETRKGKGQIGGVISDVQVPELGSIEYIDSVGGSPAERGGGISLRGFGVHLDATKPRADISFADIRGEDREVGPETLDKNINIDGAEIKVLQRREEFKYKIPNVGVSLRSVDVAIQEQKVEVGKPEVEIKPLQTEVELDGEGSKFKMPKFGIKVPKIKGPEFDLSSSKKDIEVKLPEAPEVNLPLQRVDVSIPEQMVEVRKPELEIQPLQTEVELDGQGSKFKMPKFGIKLPQIKGPEFDLSSSKKDIEVKLPEAKAGVKLPEAPEVNITLGTADVSIPEQKVEVRKPEVEFKPLQTDAEYDGQASKFKMPKFGIKMPKIKGPEFDLSLSKKEADVTLPEFKAEGKLPDAPEIDEPELQVKPLKIDGEPDGQGSKFKMPELGITMPQVKGPEIHFGLSKKDEDVTLPEAKAEVKVPEVKAKTPEIKVAPKRTEGSPLKFKMPSFKLPKFGIVTPNISAEAHDIDKDVKIDGADLKIPEEGSAINMSAPGIDIEGPSVDLKTTGTEQDGQGSKLKMPHLPKVKGPEFDLSFSKKDADKADVALGSVDVSVPEQKVEVEKPELEIKPLQTEVELDGHGSKFKMPKFGISMPKVKGPEIDFSLSKKDVDVRLPEAKAEVSLPDVELKEPSAKVEVKAPEIKVAAKDTSGSPSRFKMPTFSFSKPKVKVPDIDLNLSQKDTDITSTVKLPEAPKVDVSLGKAEVLIPEVKVEVKKPEVQIKPLHADVEYEGHGGKFKMPKFGISMPKVKGPDIDLSFSKKDVEVKSPEATAEFKLPEAPVIDVKLGKAEVSIPDVKMEVEKPELEIKPLDTQVELDGHGSKFKMPKFGIKMPKIKGPEFDLSWSKKDIDVTLPEAKAGVQLPEAPAVDVTLGSVDVSLPEQKVEVGKPEVQMKPLHADVEYEGQGGKFKMPKFGISMPEVKGPEFDFSLSKKDADVRLPEAKAEVSLPDVELKEPSAKVDIKAPEIKVAAKDTSGSPSRFKMPTFSFSKPKVKVPDIDLNLSKKDTDITSTVKLPEAPKVDVSLGKAEVLIPEVKVEVKKPEVQIKPLHADVEYEGQGGKFKMPKFGISMPKVKGPDIDLSFSKKDVEVKSPEATAEFKLPEAPEIDVKLGKAEVSIPDVKMEVEKPELEIKPLDTQVELDGHGSKFKMPKFGIKMPKIKGPEFDLSWSKKDIDVTLPEAKAGVQLPEAPAVDVTLGSVDVSLPEQKVEVGKPELEIKPLQTEVELDGHGSKIKMPKFGISMPEVKGPGFDFSLSKKDVDVRLPEAKAEVSLPDVELKEPSAKVDIKAPEIKVAAKDTSGSPSRFKMPTFSFSKPKVKVPDIDLNVSQKDTDITSTVKLPEAPKVDVSLGKAEVLIPEVKVEVKKPEVQIKPLHADVEYEGHGGKFKMPKFGISMPKVKGPDIDLSFSKKDVEVKSPEATAEFKLPEAPEIDVKLGKAEVSVPDVKMEVEKPELEMKPLDTQVELDGHGSKFKMPKFGISMPEVKGPEFDFSLSKKDVDVRLPEAKAEVSLPDVELKEPSAKVDIKAPEIKVAAKDTSGSPSRFKMPTFSFSKPKVKVPDIDLNVSQKDTDITSTVKLPEAPKVDVSLGKAEVLIPEVKVEVKKPEVQIKPLHADVEYEGQGGKFKMPKFGISMPKVKGPDIDLSFSKKDVDVKSPEATAEFKLPEAPVIDVKLGKAEVSIPDVKMEVEKPELEIKPLDTQVELDGHGSKFKMPKFGIKMPKIKGPEFDLSWSKKDIDVTLPEAKAGVKLPEAPAVDVTLGSVDVSLPEQKVEVGKPELEIKPLQTEVELDGHGSKIKMPKFGISMPEVKGPGFDFSLSKKDVDVRLPEAKAEVSLPDVELKEPSAKVDIKAPEIKVAAKDTSGSPSRFKMPTFSFSKPKVKVPDIDLNVSQKDTDITSTVKLPEAPKVDVSLGKAEVLIPEVKVEVKKPEVQIKPLHADVEYEGHGGKFKMPKFGISMPKVKGPDIDLSFSKKDVEVKSPEATAEFKLPEAPEIDVKLGKAEVSVPDVKMEVEKPELEMKPLDTQVELDGHGSKFKMPKFGISMPEVKGPEFDFSLSKKDVDVRLPEAKAEVSLPDVELKEPSAKVDIKAPEIKVAAKDTSGSPSRFKMPTFSFSKPKVKVPDIDLNVSQKDTDITSTVKLPEAPKVDVSLGKAEVLIPEVKVEVKKPEVQIKPLHADVEYEGQGGKFKMPKFGISMPKVKGPDIDLSFSKKDVDVKSPEATAEFKLPEAPVIDVKLGKAEVSIPDVKMEVEKPELEIKPLDTQVELDGHGSKFKMPKFGIKMPKIKGPEFDLSWSKKDIDVTLPEAKAGVKLPEAPAVDVTLGSVDVSLPEQKVEVGKPEVQMKPLHADVEYEGQGGKFKMPKFGISMPEVKGPDFDFSLSKKDVDVRLPEAKAEVSLPDVELKEPSAKVDIKAPEIKVAAKDTSGSPSRFKMPTFSFSKPKVKVPDIDLNVSQKDTDITSTVKLPEAPKVDVSLGKAEVLIPEVKVEVKKPEVQIKPLHADVEYEGHGGKFKMPKFGISMPKVKGPDIDLSFSKKDVEVKSPEATAEFKLPEAPEIDVKLGKAEVSIPDVKMEVEKPELEMKPLDTQVELDGHGSKFKMPKFGISMPEVKGPEFDFSLSKKDVDVRLPEAKAEVSLPDVELKEPSAKVDIKAPEIKVAAKDTSGSPSRFKMPTFSFSKPKVKVPDIDLNLSKKDTDITSTVKLPEAPKVDVSLGKAEVLIPEAKVEVKKPEVQIKPLHADVEYEGHGGKFKMPKFGISMPKVKGPDIDLSFSKKDVEVKSPEATAEFKLPEAPEIDVKLGKAEVSIPDVKMEVEKPELEMKPLDTQVELDGHGSKFKMPKFGISMPEVKGPEFDFSLSKKDADVRLPEAKAEVSLPDVELKEPSAKVDIKAPEIKVAAKDTSGSPSRFKMPTFSFSKPKVKVPDIDLNVSQKDTDITSTVKLPEAPKVDVSLGKAEVLIPEVKVEVKKPEVQIKPLHADVEYEGQGGKFKMPKFGISLPKVKGPDIDLSFSKKDVNSPEATAEFKLPEAPEIDVKLGKAEVSVPDVKMEVEKPELEMKPLDTQVELDGHGSKFKMPKFGISMPKVKGPEIDFSLSKKDVDVRLPEAKAEVSLPDVELKEPSTEVEVKGPEIEAQVGSMKGSPSKFKLPTFKFPKFGGPTPNVSAEVPDTEHEITIDGAGISVPDTDVDVEVKGKVSLPEVEVKEPSGGVVIEQPGVEVDAKMKKPKFSLPRFSFSKPSVKAPEVDVSVQNVNVELPEGKVEVKGGEVDMKPPEVEAEIDRQGSKFKLPKFGISMPKVTGPEIDLSLSNKDVDVKIPEAKAEVKLPDVDLKEPSAEVEIKPPEIKVVTKDTDGSPSKFKMPTFKLPKFGIGAPSSTIEVPDMDKDVKINGGDIEIPKQVVAVDIAAPSIDTEGPSIDLKTTATEREGKGNKFKLPSLSFSVPQVKSPDVDLSSSKTGVDVTLPGAKADVQLPDAEVKEPSAKVEIQAPGIEVHASNVEGSPSKFKMPTFKLPKFGASTTPVSVEVPDVDMKVDGEDLKLPEAKAEVKLPDVEIKEPVQGSISIDMAEGDAKVKKTSWTLPKFSFPKSNIKSPEAEVNLVTPKVDVSLPEVKAEVHLPDIDKESSGISVEGAANIDLDAKLKKPKFSMPKFSFSKQSSKDHEVDVSLPEVDVSLPEGNVEVTTSEVDLKPPEGDVKLDGQESKFKMPKFGITMPKMKGPEFDLSLSKKDVTLPEGKIEVTLPSAEVLEPEGAISLPDAPSVETEAKSKRPNWTFPKFSFSRTSGKAPDVDVNLESPKADVASPEVDLNASQKDVEVSLPNVKAEVKLPGVEVKESSANVETDAKSKDVGGSPLKFKMPTMKMPKFGGGTYDVTVEAPDADKAEKDGAKLQEDVTVEIKAPSVDIKTDSETPKTETDTVGHGSPSRFKLPSFKMPKLSFSKPKPEEEHGDTDGQEVQPETEEQTKSPKATLTAIGEIFKNFDVEFDVSPTDKVEGNLEASKEAHETSEPSGKQLDAKEKETNAKEDTPKSPERTGWFKFPKFGLSSPSEAAKTPEKDEHKDGTTSETGDEEISPTCSVQSSDAFADISSTMTSEHVGPSISSPTKVTVKYSDPDAALSLEEIHGNVITSTTRTEVISVEPHLPEKITILSSGVSSSSEDTLRLESGKIHVITSNIQATPDSQHAKLLTAAQVQSAAGPALQSQGEEAASWTVEDSQGGKRTVYQRHIVRESSSERSASKETIVITKQITRVIDSSEPISGDTATSIQRLRDSMHSEKMRFFDGAEK
ncbi:neuroblast differentiation-associated protein AHNAK-like [Hippoglossus hippoglossus]|uniref:neuroblast differentiation-associated protein AHNAK-like n=1 Tax=Hippoglossus hippoglossus TaxID=8267 RepID=UPI00148B5833|nr:neuroblast differentiation-associated protein AHNAK-like [Hippoglossus hippoglossus]